MDTLECSARAEAMLVDIPGRIADRLEAVYVEAVARAIIASSNADGEAALVWGDLGEAILVAVDFLALRGRS